MAEKADKPAKRKAAKRKTTPNMAVVEPIPEAAPKPKPRRSRKKTRLAGVRVRASEGGGIKRVKRQRGRYGNCIEARAARGVGAVRTQERAVVYRAAVSRWAAFGRSLQRAQSWRRTDANGARLLLKGRKPLVLVRAVVLGCLLPATDDPAKDLDIFLKLMAMDDEGSPGASRASKHPTSILIGWDLPISFRPTVASRSGCKVLTTKQLIGSSPNGFQPSPMRGAFVIACGRRNWTIAPMFQYGRR